jgi:hypothetical protein
MLTPKLLAVCNNPDSEISTLNKCVAQRKKAPGVNHREETDAGKGPGSEVHVEAAGLFVKDVGETVCAPAGDQIHNKNRNHRQCVADVVQQNASGGLDEPEVNRGVLSKRDKIGD